jgi:DMSO/TMAO reductase YedYZ molybdopterin-dependent catalytic subunit
MSDSIDRRGFLIAATAATVVSASGSRRALGFESGGPNASEVGPARSGRPFLTDAEEFVDVSRGDPKPFTLKGEALIEARLAPESWRLEIVGDNSSEVARPKRIDDGTALDLATLEELGKSRRVVFLKAMQCNNIPVPLGQGLWEGIPLRDVLRLAGEVGNVRRVYYWGYHNNDPRQLFQSSLSYNQVMETPPGEFPPIVAYRLNGRPIPLRRGGPVRMVVPWAHGFKSIKWLQRIVLTNDYQANDTYALQNNDPDSYLKTAAYHDKGQEVFEPGEPILMTGTAMAGWSGLKRVEYWLRPDTGDGVELPLDDPTWRSARWEPCGLMPPPDDWGGLLPAGIATETLLGFDPTTGRPRDWPPRYSVVPWSVTLKGLNPGAYEFRARAVDLNGFAQPEPRTYQKSGRNLVQCRRFTVLA